MDDWIGSFTDDETAMQLRDRTTNHSQSVDLTKSALRFGVTVFYTISNLASDSAPEGQIVVTDSLGEILATETSPKINSGSIDHSIVVNWPSGITSK